MPLPASESADLRKRLLQGAVLTMAALPASMGVSFGCFARNLILWPEMFGPGLPGLGGGEGKAPPTLEPHGGRLPGTGLDDIALTLACLLGMLVWGWAVVMFVRERPRSPSTYLVTAVIAGVFLWSSWGVWRFAYPVCNAF